MRAYNEMYGERVGMTGDEFRELRNTVNTNHPNKGAQYDKARGN